MVFGGTKKGSGWRDRLAFPALWLAGSLFMLLLSGLSLTNIAPSGDLSDTYYLFARTHHTVTLAAAFAVFAGIYLVFDTAFDVRFRRPLGWAHFVLMLLGASLIVAPSLLLRLNAIPSRYDDPQRALVLWAHVSAIGYSMTLASVLLFVGLLAEALARRVLDKGRPDIN